MKDFIKINRAIDQKNLQVVRHNLAELQKIGAYPKRFIYPITLQFELTGQCNLACKHCYNRSGDSDRETLMTPDKWCELSRQIVADGGIFQCILSGGEPLLLGDKIFDIMDILHDDGTSFVVISNGFLLTREMAKKFAKYRYFWFQISIDGADEHTHDEFRGIKGSFQKAVNAALEISNASIPLVIAHSVTPKNLLDLEKMVHLAYTLGANTIILGEVLPSGRAIENSEIVLSEEQRNKLYSDINDLGKKYQGRIIIKRSSELKFQLERYQSEVNAGGIIRPNGDFRLDCMAPFTIGNVMQAPLKEIWLEKGINAWESQRVQKFIDSINVDEQAGDIKNHVDKDIAL